MTEETAQVNMQRFKLISGVPLLYLLLILWIPSCLAVQVTNIRLVGGPDDRSGRIEIQVDNIDAWGSICDDGWDDKEAIVACRQLGYTNGGTAVTTQIYGPGSFNFLMDDSACTGDESTLTECISSQSSDCTPQGDVEAGVVCNENLGPGQPTPTPRTTTTVQPNFISGNCQQANPTARLIGKPGIDGTGYVQVLDPNNVWGYVCDDGWNEAAAKVVCAQLCFPTNYTAKPGIPAEHKVQVNSADASILLDNVNCAGTEATIQDCPHSTWGVQDCLQSDGELAGVQCVEAPYQPPPPPVPILECGNGVLVAQFLRANDANLEEKHLSIFNQPNCPDVTKSTTTDYVTIRFPVDKCGTVISRNGTHILYYNEVKYDYTSQEGVITRVNTYRVQLTCSLPIGLQVTQRVQPLTEAVTQASVGNFPLAMEIYRSDSFDNPVTDNPVQIPLGEWLNMAISMEEYDPRLKLVATNCVTTPTGDKGGTVKKVLFENKCSDEPTLSFYPLSNFKYGFRFKPFKFVGFDLLYIHCDAIICLVSANTRECDRTCGNNKVNTTDPPTTGRRKRSLEIFYKSVDSQAIMLYDPHAPGPDFGSKPDDGNEPVKTVIGANDPLLIKTEPKPKQETTTVRTQQAPQNEAPPSMTRHVVAGPEEEKSNGNTGPRILYAWLTLLSFTFVIVLNALT